MKKLLFLAIPTLFLMAGCSTMPDMFSQTVEGMVSNGSITPSQGEAVIEAFDAAAQSQAWWEMPLTIIAGALLSFLGVRSNLPLIGRGAPTQKVGLPATKVKS